MVSMSSRLIGTSSSLLDSSGVGGFLMRGLGFGFALAFSFTTGGLPRLFGAATAGGSGADSGSGAASSAVSSTGSAGGSTGSSTGSAGGSSTLSKLII